VAALGAEIGGGAEVVAAGGAKADGAAAKKRTVKGKCAKQGRDDQKDEDGPKWNVPVVNDQRSGNVIEPSIVDAGVGAVEIRISSVETERVGTGVQAVGGEKATI